MTAKLAISLPDDLVADARAAVAAGRAASLSQYVARAMAAQRREQDVAELLAEMAVDGGVPSAEDHAWARRALGLD
ncbi:MAG: carboxymuconolactone decarboxylase family protein [Solirubrobacteraceae bacterium]|nr:carboxymuconolactone decarboxylase family protein [Solirubrobacteraceae bacterium]